MITQQTEQPSPVIQQIGLLNLRINDMLTQLNNVINAVMEENAALKKENNALKEEKQTKPKQ
jgi:regulator of replication initiation timing